MSQYIRPTGSDSYRRSAAFTFKKRTEKVDWRKLAAIDVNRIAREIDFTSLQESMMTVTYCNIEAEMESHLVDPNFVKLFQLSQFIIEYLMHCQQFLQLKMSEVENSLKEKVEGIEKLSKDVEEKQNTVNHLKKENRKARKMVAEYQLMMRSGASGMHKCPFCPKVFVSNDYLLAHIQRRHSEHAGQFAGGMPSPLKDASNHLRNQHPENSENQMNRELLQELKDIKERLASTERQLQKSKVDHDQAEREDQELAKIRELEERYAQWKADEQQRQVNEMNEFKNSVMVELQQVHEQKGALENRVSELQQKSARPSLVRGIHDEDEVDAPPSKQQQENMETLRKELQNEIHSIHSQAENNMKRLKHSWQTKEKKMKRQNEADKDKYETMLKQFDEALEAERREKREMAKNFEVLNKKMQERESERPIGKPPLARSPDDSGTSTMARPEAPQEDDTIMLYVAFDGSNYQVRREPSGLSRGWSDQFTFNACLQPKKAFNSPIYVYTSGGSPYWRQYISTSSAPPSSEYRFDYVFYAACEPLARTTAYYVLQSGSVPVIKSCISRTPELKGWKDTGIVFYVLKPTRANSPPKSFNKSGTFTSDTGTEGDDLSDSEDDIDVSSLNTATESAKNNLAIEINRSKVEELQQRPLPPPPPQEESVESVESDDDEPSETDWGTTLETGTFRPFDNYPEIITRYNHKNDTLAECKQEVKEMFEQSLAKRGIQPGTVRLSTKQLESRMESLKSEQEGRAKKFKNFREIRKRKAEEVDAMAKQVLKLRKSVRPGDESHGSFGQKTPAARSSLRSAVAAVTAARGFADRGVKRKETKPELTSSQRPLPKPRSDLNRSLMSTGGSVTTVTERSVSMSEDESVQEEERVNRRIDQQDMTDEGSDEDTDWDSALSGDEAPHGQAVPKVSVHIPSQRSQIQEMASSLERSLESSAEIKKPVGAVALIHSTPATAKPPPKVELENFDDDSDFLSSLEERENKPQNYQSGFKKPSSLSPGTAPSQTPSPKKGVKFKMDNYSDFDDSDLDIENIS